MIKVYEFLANGFEEIEALAPVDILRRGGVNVKTVSITGSEYAESAHGVSVKADLRFENVNDFEDAELLFMPGGMPGATNLNKHKELRELLLKHHEQGKYIGAICAAPMVLGSLGIVKGKKATCYPGFEKFLEGAEYTAELCTVDGNIITGKGPAASFAYGLTLLEKLTSKETAEEVKAGMLINETQETN
nr:DJ-1 family glyoxalase III [uncultured Prevotella sp.]